MVVGVERKAYKSLDGYNFFIQGRVSNEQECTCRYKPGSCTPYNCQTLNSCWCYYRDEKYGQVLPVKMKSAHFIYGVS